jgi:glutathione S-transferase
MGTLWANLRPAFIEVIRTPPENKDRASIAAAIRKTAEKWAMLDAHLVGRDYVSGPASTMADIPLGASAYRWFGLDSNDLTCPTWRPRTSVCVIELLTERT